MYVIIEVVDNYKCYPKRTTKLVGSFEMLRDAQSYANQLMGRTIIHHREENLEPTSADLRYLEYEDYLEYRWYIFDTEDTRIEYRIP